VARVRERAIMLQNSSGDYRQQAPKRVACNASSSKRDATGHTLDEISPPGCLGRTAQHLSRVTTALRQGSHSPISSRKAQIDPLQTFIIVVHRRNLSSVIGRSRTRFPVA
jgi:hypothetical protein